MRQSGVLMHITSLPGPYGVGTMGKHAYAFVDFLRKAGQSKWQVLPLTPTGFGDSPYQSCSAFAGNPYLIDLETLVEDGLLYTSELESVCWGDREDRVDFGLLYENRQKILRLAYERFEAAEELDAFCRQCCDWLPDFALFMALKDANGGKPWFDWEDRFKNREPDALWQARRELKEHIRFYCFVQYLFHKQWDALRAYAHGSGVEIIGDVPIYVPLDSADVWSGTELFELDDRLDPIAVAGCPPDAFSEDGQLWGNPLYRWDVHKKDGYSWWLRRIRAAAERYDVIRVDHFRGFESYWSVPYGAETARGGKWEKGPGMDFFRVLQRQMPQVRMIAEDLGFITPEVKALRDETGFPGMKVLQFAFDSEDSEYLPHNCTAHSVCYTGTHDNMTTAQWLQAAPEHTRAYATRYMHLHEQEGLVWGVIRTAMAAVSELCIVQLQDYLELGEEARMNFPGTNTDSNWTWRAVPGVMTDELAQRIRELTGLYGRLAKKNQHDDEFHS